MTSRPDEIQSRHFGDPLRTRLYRFAFLGVFIATSGFAPAAVADGPNQPKISSAQDGDLALQLGVQFVDGSATKVVLERNGRHYELDLATRHVREIVQPADTDALPKADAQTGGATPSGNSAQADNTNNAPRRYYRPGDDFLFSLPTGRAIDKHSLTINFTHRFPYEPAFITPARGATILGLDDFSISSFGLQYGITTRLSVSAFRSPSIIGRPIELGVKYAFAGERRDFLNITGRFSVDGQDNFARNFTTNFELITSRSLGRRAQVYVVPTLSVNNRPVLGAQTLLTNPLPYEPCAQAFANGIPLSFQVRPCADTFSVGVGAAVDIRPTVALVGEIIPTAVNGTELGIHRVPFAIGIQKKIYHHSFTLGLTTAPGTTTSQRIGTRATYLRQPGADTPSNMFLGFDIMRQIP